MLELESKKRAAIDDLALLPDPQERMSWLVDQARRAPPLPKELKTEANRVPGCVSTVWMHHWLESGRLRLQGDAESPLVRALVLFLVRVYDGATVEEVAAGGLDPLEESGLLAGLSPTRHNGLRAVQQQIRNWAGSA